MFKSIFQIFAGIFVLALGAHLLGFRGLSGAAGAALMWLPLILVMCIPTYFVSLIFGSLFGIKGIANKAVVIAIGAPVAGAMLHLMFGMMFNMYPLAFLGNTFNPVVTGDGWFSTIANYLVFTLVIATPIYTLIAGSGEE